MHIDFVMCNNKRGYIYETNPVFHGFQSALQWVFIYFYIVHILYI